MVADFSIKNNTYSSGQRNRETLRRLAKEIFDNAEKKERKVEQVIPYKEDYVTRDYIPAEIYIYNLSVHAFTNNNLKQSLNFLNNKAAIKSFSKEQPQDTENTVTEDDIFVLTLDESKNIFAA